MATKTVSIDGVGEVTLYKRRGIRNMRLSINHEGGVRVSLPYWAPYQAAKIFAESRRDWILSQRPKPFIAQNGQQIGKKHRLVVSHLAGRSTTSCRVTDNEIRVSAPLHVRPDDSNLQAAIKRAATRALRQQAEEILPGRIREFANTHGFSFRSVSVKQLKSRWGSCSSHGDIVLNIYLMQLPWELIDYVLLHELLHTRLLAHGPTFWQNLAQYVPNLALIRKEIRSYQPTLLLH